MTKERNMENKLSPEDHERQVEELQQYLEHYSSEFKRAYYSKTRQEQLINRASTLRDSKRFAKISRRLATANKEVDTISETMETLRLRLEGLGVEVSIVSKHNAETALRAALA